MAEQMAVGIMGGAAPAPGDDASKNVGQTEALGGSEKKEAAGTKKARQRVAESTSPT
jgi:hypothetical protein